MKDKIFSPAETTVIKILGRKKLTLADLADRYYEVTNNPKTIEPNNSMASVVSRINKKAVFHDLNWFLDGEGLGRGGRTVWRSARE